MKKVVVTGGAGFIGLHLCEALADRGYSVIILDDLSTGKKANIEPLLDRENVEFIEGSVTDLTRLEKIFQGAGYVFHLAAIASILQSMKDPLTCHEVNITGTLNVLLAARDNNIDKVIYASSSSVYGDTYTLPQKEDMLPDPRSPYAVAKLAGEYYCRVFHQVYHLPTVCLRYFNVYGPRQDPDSQYAAVIPRFIKRLSQSRPPVIFGDGEQTRDFVFVKDAVTASILAAESNATGIFNIGRNESITINQLAVLIIRLVGNVIEPIHAEVRPDDIKHSLADISRARTFGYRPKWSLEDGLKETIKSFQTEV